MSHELYIKCVSACLLGNLLHIILACFNRFKDNKAANIPFSMGRYIRDDKWVFITDAIFSLAVVYLYDEWEDLTPWLTEKVKTFFVFVGITGSYVFNSILSVSKTKFRNYVDTATDVAEGKQDKAALESKPNQDLKP